MKKFDVIAWVIITFAFIYLSASTLTASINEHGLLIVAGLLVFLAICSGLELIKTIRNK